MIRLNQIICCLLALPLTAIASTGERPREGTGEGTVPCPIEENDAAFLLRTMEKALRAAKTARIRVETIIECSTVKGIAKGTITLGPNNQAHIAMEMGLQHQREKRKSWGPIRTEHILVICDGKHCVERRGKEVTKKYLPDHNDRVLAVLKHGGLVAWTYMKWRDGSHGLLADPVFEISDFRLRKKTTIGKNAAQSVDYALALERGPEFRETIWLDDKTGLPLKRVYSGGEEYRYQFTETYSEFQLDVPVDVKLFRFVDQDSRHAEPFVTPKETSPEQCLERMLEAKNLKELFRCLSKESRQLLVGQLLLTAGRFLLAQEKLPEDEDFKAAAARIHRLFDMHKVSSATVLKRRSEANAIGSPLADPVNWRKIEMSLAQDVAGPVELFEGLLSVVASVGGSKVTVDDFRTQFVPPGASFAKVQVKGDEAEGVLSWSKRWRTFSEPRFLCLEDGEWKLDLIRLHDHRRNAASKVLDVGHK